EFRTFLSYTIWLRPQGLIKSCKRAVVDFAVAWRSQATRHRLDQELKGILGSNERTLAQVGAAKMSRYVYPLDLEPDDNGTLLVTSKDFPELTTFGTDEADALRHAADALAVITAQ